MRKMNRPTVYDPLIINRVKQYLEDNVHQTFLDVGIMAKALQERYPEYSRRKFVPFRMLVEQAYTTLSKSILKDGGPPSDDSDGSDLEVMDDSTDISPLNNMLTSLYSKPKNVAGNRGGNNELIDISSDESADDTRKNGKSKSKDTGIVGVKQFREITLTKVGNDNHQPPLLPLPSSKKDQSTPNVAPQKRGDIRSVTVDHSTKKRKVQSRSQSPKNGNNTQMEKAPLESSLLSSFQQKTAQQQHQQLQHQQQQPPQKQRAGIFSLNHFGSGNSNDGVQFPLHSSQANGRKYKKEVQPQKSRQTFQDIGGMDKVLKELCELLMHIKQPDIYFVLGLMPPRGILLHGPPGCGKTLLAQAVAGQLGIPLIEVPATELIAGVSGESEERIRDIFEQASGCAPCVLFIDEIDAISSNRSNAQRDMERRIVSQLISSLDSLRVSENGQSVLVIGATTRPDVLDPALRRVGRFDHEIAIGIPNRKDRKDILTIICDGLSVEQKCDYDKIAELTPGYVGADLLALVSRAATIAVKRKCSEQMREFQAKTRQNITIVDLDDEVDDVAPKTDVDKSDADLKEITEKDKKENESIEVEEIVDASKNDTTTVPADQGEAEKINGAITEEAEVENMEVEEEADVVADSIEMTHVNNTELAEEKTEITAPVADAVEVADAGADGIAATDEEPPSASAEETIDVDEVSEVNTKKFPEPTLFEMLNWLDKTPEDISQVGDFCITFEDFREAVKVVQPSAKREGFITVPDVTWDDIGSLQDIREELKLAVLAPVKFPEKLAQLGLSAPSGVLLCGPPGCGKTLLAKAIANEAGINFISVKGPELMNMYVGESERAVRACFQRARNSSPCVIFFDEFDSLCPKRSENNEAGSGTRVVNQLLTEMDGVEDRKGVYILAATNRPDIIDPAILRPGRLDTILYVGLPQTKDREEILMAQTKNRTKPVLNDDVDFGELAAKTDGYTGADLAGLVRQASMLALKESINNSEISLDDLSVNASHFECSLKLLRPSVTPEDRKIYDKLRDKYAAPRVPTPTKAV